MNSRLIPTFRELYIKFKGTDDYQNRKKQFKIVGILRDIINLTISQDSLTNEHLTGFIQMFKFGCSDATFDKYLIQNVKDLDKINELSDRAYQADEWGYTGAGLNSIYGLSAGQLETVRQFLKGAFEVDTVDQAVILCTEFDQNKIPLVTMGIYSPWLYYINPELFPILNNSHADFKNWIGAAADYPSNIKDFNDLKLEVQETDLGIIDMFAHNFKKYNALENLTTFDLNGRKLFKISHGIFVKQKKYRDAGFAQILETNSWICMGKYTGKGQAEAFKEKASIGDFVYLSYGGDTLLYLAEIVSDPSPLDKDLDEMIDGRGEWVIRQVKQIFYPIDKNLKDLKGETKSFMPSGNSTFYEVPADLRTINEKLFIPKFKVEIKNLSRTNQKGKLKTENMDSESLNQILYGPPGTGKTYNSIDKAVKIATGSSSGTHSENKEVFDQLRKEGQIEFVTFHQGYSYEDFMVGIKPNVETEMLTFRPHMGIFYKLVDRSKKNYLASRDRKSLSKSFEEALDDLLEPLNNGVPVKIDMLSGKHFNITGADGNTIRFEKYQEGYRHTLNIETLRLLVEGKREVNGLKSYYIPLIERIKRVMNETESSNAPVEELKNYVLIIDEINRANISKVFGELITLLEDDKRIDGENELPITLPNGELNFCIPPNLYIIGTMNTADKSISLIDVALRRRFEFIAYYPDFRVLKGQYSAHVGLLQKLNEAIYSRKKAADFLIGHGYFMKPEPIQQIILNKIIPLLMEYFSGRLEDVQEILKYAGQQVSYNIQDFKWQFDLVNSQADESTVE